MRPVLAAMAIFGAADAAAAERTCSLDADVIVRVLDKGNLVEVRHEDFPSTVTIAEDGDGILMDGRRCGRVGETRFRCEGHEMTEVAIVGTRMRLMTADLGGVDGETGFILFSGTCEDTN